MGGVRVLVVSHGHPDFSLGGGEISAHAQWHELRRRGIEAVFLARSSDSPGHLGSPISARSANGAELLFSVPPVNHFRHSQPDGPTVYRHFRDLLEDFRPTAVHFHHYVHLGLELIREVRNYNPDVSITVTLHEFLAICHAQGQMLKTNGMLCGRAGALDCHGCFPDISPQDFFMRELFVKSFFNLVDHFVCPSRFLRDRYVAWGLPLEKMVLLDNGQPPRSASSAIAADHANERRFAVLGQLSRLKGTLVVLDAVRLLPKRLRKKLRLEIHGSVQYADENFKAELARSLEGLADTVRLCGPYLPGHVSGILRRTGWLIVPSIWWENSPLVIQESFASGRPVLCSNIGGMAEKVEDGVSGFHFRVNNASDLAARMEECAEQPEMWQRMCAGIAAPLTTEQAVDGLISLYTSRAPSSLDRQHEQPTVAPLSS